ncbi:biotin--[acetyl-CoA-carboxylase] ligase [Saccharomycopsis crataegensis]|uniref:Biotin--[acetyl-CoA-carboxylase] ligase n=1 Tax=Saccharomycopsis crataegensis TaxID=43959 RepID=A0AAV5QE75_9ASCO|nr:biotin--[acetyl-CoA-carboxylase] ligase [Saccharomycopsis crataegensis]
MNVLVYSGNGTTAESVKHCLYTLRRFLSPHYAVISVDANVIRKEPWAEKTSLLVFPGGADLPFCSEFNGEGNRKIKQFVKRGGKYMGFCAGAYYASSRLEFETGSDIEVSGSRELKFFPGTAVGTAFKGFRYSSNNGERAAYCSIEPTLADGETHSFNTFFSHYNGGPTFYDAEKFDKVEVLSRYLEPIDADSGEAKTNAAIIHCEVGDGSAILFGPHVEFEPSLLKYSHSRKDSAMIQRLESNSSQRDYFLRLCLKKLGLKVNNAEDAIVPKLTPLLLSSINEEELRRMVSNIEANVGYQDDEKSIIKDANDSFHVTKISDSQASIPSKMNSDDYDDPDAAVKEIWIFENGEVPYYRMTPYFNITAYYSNLTAIWKEENEKTPFYPKDFTYGKTLLYGEILTSTNTLIEKNYKILQYLPDGYTAIGTTQISGRGRGGNVWVSPMGTLAISTVVRLSFEDAVNSPVIFAQYLTSMAMVDAILGYGEGYDEMPVRLKWPNDIYVMKPSFLAKYGNKGPPKYVNEIDPIYAKIGGLLISTVAQQDNYVMVIGAGINVSNAGPTTTLNLVLNQLNHLRAAKGQPPLPNYTTEKLAAKFMVSLDKLFAIFKTSGFTSLLPKYYNYWLHEDQIVTLGSIGSTKAQIRGISSTNGLLVVEELNRDDTPTGKTFELQPDGNSFDMFNGLITRKHNR